MHIRRTHGRPRTTAEALAIQERLRPLVDTGARGPAEPRRIAGLDVAYDKHSDRLAAAVVVLDAATLAVREELVVIGRVAFGYVPGLFAFRELPALIEALERLRCEPDVLVCDGHGIAHPRRFGLACHLGVLTDLPAIGVAKTLLTGTYEEPGQERGAWRPLCDEGEIIGRILRTRTGVKPVFVSVGHKVNLDDACRYVLDLCPKYRLPETTRRADQLSRRCL